MLEPLPDRDRLSEMLLNFEVVGDESSRDALRFYATYHAQRFLRTMELMPPLPPETKVLELGAAPFFMTVLLERHFGFKVTTANFFGDYGDPVTQPQGSQTLTHRSSGETHRFDFAMFNVERDTYPYDDAAFDLVICCEILEHLACDPSHMLRECNRVLREGGRLFLTTPNVASLGNVVKLVRGGSIYQAFSGDGVYGRHNREFSGPELALLLEAHGFASSVVHEDAYPHSRLARALTAVPPLRRFRDNLFVTATKREDALPRYPDWLYVGYRQKHAPAGSSIVMEDRDPSRLGDGWHEYECWPPGIRWTSERATARLMLGESAEPRLELRLYSGAAGARGSVRISGREAGAFVLAPNDRQNCRYSIGSLLDDPRPGEEIEIELVADTFVPAETSPGSTDRRRLGVAVESLWIE